jgi:2-amino-4-hydroxy-6-hydroxymethyldihydropteridine diphosphokinase
MNKAYLLTGGNEGDRDRNLQQAKTNIELICGRLLRVSSLYETAPWGKPGQPDFLNQALLLETKWNPRELMTELLKIEAMGGRMRSGKNAPRLIDIDILFYEELVINEPGLNIPHPRIAERRFVLEPMNEIAPGFVHPIFKKTIQELLKICPDLLPVKKIS